MGRRIVTSSLQANQGDDGTDGYSSKIVKFVPADIIAAWLGVSALLSAGAGGRTVLMWIVFGVLLVLTPLWVLRTTRVPPKPPAWSQAAMSTIAFAVWVFAAGGPFAASGLHDPVIGGIVLILFTLVSALVDPDRAKNPG